MAQTPLRPAATARKAPRQTLPPALGKTRYPRNVPAPVLVEVHRGPFVESRHRGHVVQVDVSGRVEQGIGDPDLVTSVRSAMKPFGVVALLEAGAAEAFHLTDPEIAVLSSSHHGEDAHVRTVQAMLRVRAWRSMSSNSRCQPRRRTLSKGTPSSQLELSWRGTRTTTV